MALNSNISAVNLPVAAYAAGVSPDCMRGWLNRGGPVRLLAPRPAKGAWLRAAPVDVVRLAVLGHLVRFGCTKAEANGIVIEYIDRHLEGVVLATGDCRWPEIVSKLAGRTLTVSREASGLSVSFADRNGGRSAKHTAAKLEINVGMIASDVRRRVREMNGGSE